MLEIHPNALDSLINGTHGAPFDILGPHSNPEGESTVVRAYRPGASGISVKVLKTETVYKMIELRKDSGFYEVSVPEKNLRPEDYQFSIQYPDYEQVTFDAYAFPPFLSDYDIYLLREGRHFESYRRFGAQLREVNGVKGVNFAVWAPNAFRVSVIGDFNTWNETTNAMRLRGQSGIWEIFIPGLTVGALYKFHIATRYKGYQVAKTDPYGQWAEMRPKTSSIVSDLDAYEWQDEEWLAKREQKNALNAPISIYEVHPGSWRRKNGHEWLTYRDMAEILIPYVKEMGYTHLELMPVAEHPLDASWGYQVTSYFAPTSRFGTPDDFKYFVDQCHQQDIAVILDWVPAHFPKDEHGLGFFDGTHLYEHSDPRKGEHPDWGTLIFNFGRNEVKNFLISNAIYWLKEFHIDGLRVDAVSSMLYLDFGRDSGGWVPNQFGGNENLDAIEFLKEANAVIHSECEHVLTIAEESTSWPMVSRPTYLGGLGFSMKWNMGWMHDTLNYMKEDPIYRRFHHHMLTFSLMYAFTENFVLSLSHDEVVHGKGSMINKMAGDWWQKFANLRLMYGYQMTHPGKKLLFMGQEFGQWNEWSEERSLEWDLLDFPTHKALQNWVKHLNELYKSHEALYDNDFEASGFQWIEANDSDQSVYSYIRKNRAGDKHLIIIGNFTPVVRHQYRIGTPREGVYKEILNSDADLFGGSNIINPQDLQTEKLGWHRFSQSIVVTLPPLGITILEIQEK
ncbi:1,4-alpha-glucan branching enzyme [Anaerolineales bacterium]